jgi:hypothetical protein
MPAPVDCPELDCWQALFGDELPPAERQRYERHLESCRACQERLDRLDDFGGTLGRARASGDPTTAPADPILTQIVARLHNVKSPVRATDEVDLYFLRPAGRAELLGTLGPYQVEEVIGQGGMGVVLRAYEPALHRLVAIKVLSPALAGSATARLRFTREAQAAAAISHDHVVVVHGVAETDGLPYLVMEYVAGESLQERLDRAGPLDLIEVVRIGLQTAQGLAAAHAQGLIHRDIKPANLLLENGLARVTITDFGLARTVDDVGLTQAGVVAGTPEYMAPEQARGAAIDHRADLFSLGSVLYVMATGEPPFRGSTTLAVLRHVCEETPPPVRALNPNLTAWLEALIMRLMAKEPADRFRSAAEVAGLLEGYLAHLHQPLSASVPPLPAVGALEKDRPDRRRWWLVAAVAVAACLLVPALLLAKWLGNLQQVAAAPAAPAKNEFYQDFRKPLHPAMQWSGLGARDEVVESDARGIRVKLPANRGGTSPVGLAIREPLKGDFEVTASYELLDTPRPRRGSGVGFELYLMTRTPTRDGIVFARMKNGEDRDEYVVGRNRDEDGKRRGNFRNFPAAAAAGQLRLTRKGEEFLFAASEGEGGAFEELARFPWGADDVTLVRVGAGTSGRPEGVEVRFVDLRVRASDLNPDLGGNPVAPDAAAPVQLGDRTWLLLALALVVLIGLSALAAGLITVLARRRQPALPPANPPAKDAEPPPVAFPCSGCGKNLRARAELAGKKVKCPKCGKTTVVPGDRTGIRI